MDVVIPYRNSSSNGFELRYTLRGIEKFFPELENIFIIGDCPSFLQNVIHIPATDSPERQYKQLNIYRKLLTACEDKRVSDSFAWVSDDHFLLKPFQSEYYYSGPLEQSIVKFTPHQSFRQTLLNTMVALQNGNDYDQHCPYVFQKEKFIKVMKMVDWSKSWGYGIKSLYCNLTGIEGFCYSVLKVRLSLKFTELVELIYDRPFFSIDDRGLNDEMKSLLESLYPNKSQFEA